MLLPSFGNFEILSCLPFTLALLWILGCFLVPRIPLSFCLKALPVTLLSSGGSTARWRGAWASGAGHMVLNSSSAAHWLYDCGQCYVILLSFSCLLYQTRVITSFTE